MHRGGGGLGLVTMNERARAVGATVDVASQPARGTTVRVQGPTVLPGQDALTDASAQADPAEAAAVTQKLPAN